MRIKTSCRHGSLTFRGQHNEITTVTNARPGFVWSPKDMMVGPDDDPIVFPTSSLHTLAD
jgi:hypothetical protein